MTKSFWLNNPKILFDKNHIGELWPTKDLDYTDKLNAVTRLVLILAIFGLITGNYMKILMATFVTLVIIVIMYNSKKSQSIKDKIKKEIVKEGFTNPAVLNMKKPQVTMPTKKKSINECYFT